MYDVGGAVQQQNVQGQEMQLCRSSTLIKAKNRQLKLNYFSHNPLVLVSVLWFCFKSWLGFLSGSYVL